MWVATAMALWYRGQNVMSGSQESGFHCHLSLWFLILRIWRILPKIQSVFFLKKQTNNLSSFNNSLYSKWILFCICAEPHRQSPSLGFILRSAELLGWDDIEEEFRLPRTAVNKVINWTNLDKKVVELSLVCWHDLHPDFPRHFKKAIFLCDLNMPSIRLQPSMLISIPIETKFHKNYKILQFLKMWTFTSKAIFFKLISISQCFCFCFADVKYEMS